MWCVRVWYFCWEFSRLGRVRGEFESAYTIFLASCGQKFTQTLFSDSFTGINPENCLTLIRIFYNYFLTDNPDLHAVLVIWDNKSSVVPTRPAWEYRTQIGNDTTPWPDSNIKLSFPWYTPNRIISIQRSSRIETLKLELLKNHTNVFWTPKEWTRDPHLLSSNGQIIEMKSCSNLDTPEDPQWQRLGSRGLNKVPTEEECHAIQLPFKIYPKTVDCYNAKFTINLKHLVSGQKPETPWTGYYAMFNGAKLAVSNMFEA